MGIGGHVLGLRKLRRLQRLTGLPLDRAIIRNHYCEGVVWTDTGCSAHYEIDLSTGEATVIEEPFHWGTCRPEGREELNA